MDESQRGKIRNRALAQRIMDFSRLRWGKITPTDIDAVVEFGNRCFIIIEAKGVGVPVKYGQLTALERLLVRLDNPFQNNALPESKAMVIIADCDNDDPQDVDLAACIVRESWVVIRNDAGYPVIKRAKGKGELVIDLANRFIVACGVTIH